MFLKLKHFKNMASIFNTYLISWAPFRPTLGKVPVELAPNVGPLVFVSVCVCTLEALQPLDLAPTSNCPCSGVVLRTFAVGEPPFVRISMC